MRAATYVVKPGDTLTKQIALSLFADSGYSLEVHGPNGFYGAFSGQPTSPRRIEVGTSYQRKGGRADWQRASSSAECRW